MTLRKIIAGTIAGLATLGATMATPKIARADPPLMVQRWDTKETKLEKSGNIEGTDLGYYGFVSLYPNRYYGEASVSKPIAGRLSGMVEGNFGDEYEDCLRAGISYVPKTPEGTFLQLKYLPIATADKGQQAGLVFKARNGRAFTNNWLDYNFEPGTAVGEGSVGYDLTDNLSALVRVPYKSTDGFGDPILGLGLRLK